MRTYDVSMLLLPAVDRISALPDELLLHILSFLPTNFAFFTTVLSKRWNALYNVNSLIELRFDDEGVRGKESYHRYCRFVNALLLCKRVQHQHLKTFSFISRSNVFGCNVNACIEAAKRRRVENLVLSRTLFLSPNIFTSKTLVVLTLSELTVERQVGSVDLPLLKTLHLTRVLFQKRDDVKKILNGCPILEDFNASSVSFLGLRYATEGYKTLPNLVKARIQTFDVPFKAVCNVKFLRLELMERRNRNKYVDSYFRRMPLFRNLISIELCFTYFPGWDSVVEVLPYCPKLQTLVIEKCTYGQFYNKEWASTGRVPECVSLHLRTCSIGNYQGMYDDFQFAAYIIQNARLLQVITLHIDPYVEESEKDRCFNHLSQCPRISPACKIKCK